MSRYPQMAGLSQRDRSVLGRFGAFCAQEGLGPAGGGLSKTRRSSRRFWPWAVGPWHPHSAGTYRSVLWRLGGTVSPSPGSLSRFCCSSPYSASESRPCGRWPRHQSSVLRITLRHGPARPPCSVPVSIPASSPRSWHAMCIVMTAQPVSPLAAPVPALCAWCLPMTSPWPQWQSGNRDICSVRAPRCARPRTSSARSAPPWCTTPTRWPSSADGPGPPSSAPIYVAHTPLGELCTMAGVLGVESLAALCPPRRGCPSIQGRPAAAAGS